MCVLQHVMLAEDEPQTWLSRLLGIQLRKGKQASKSAAGALTLGARLYYTHAEGSVWLGKPFTVTT